MPIKPILFNTEMVRALLEGRKTMTRRVVKPQPVLDGHLWKLGGAAWNDSVLSVPVMFGHSLYNRAPYQPGDVLYVRETFRVDCLSDIVGIGRVQYKADSSYANIHFAEDRYDMMRRAQSKPGWRPNENMPREAARIFLRVTGVRIERLQAIAEEDAKAEGAEKMYPYTDPETGKTAFLLHEKGTYRAGFSQIWDSTIPKRPNMFDRYLYYWEYNPWVWVIEFERIKKEEAEHAKPE